MRRRRGLVLFAALALPGVAIGCGGSSGSGPNPAATNDGGVPDSGSTITDSSVMDGTMAMAPEGGGPSEAGEGGNPEAGGSNPEAGAEAGSDTDASAVHMSGALAKGPFVEGSSVVVSPTDSLGNPTGQNFQTSTTDDLGDFSLTFTYQGPALLTGTGFYFNEAEGALSNAQIALKGFAQVTQSGSQNAYVNLVTHLAFNREQTLLATESFSAAVAQAEMDLRGQIAVGGPTFDPGASGSQLNLLGGDNVQSAYLFAVGSVFAEAAELYQASGSEDAKLQEIVNTAASNLATSGTLPAATVTLLGKAQQCVEPDVYMASLQARFNATVATTVVPNINRALDSDLDGVPNITDNCVLVANAGQNTITNGVCNYERGSVTPSSTSGNGSVITLSADLDGVHGADLVDFSTGEIDAWLNGGSGNFGSPIVTTAATAGLVPFQAGATIGAAVLGDIDGDSKPDILVSVQQHSSPGQLPQIGYFAGDGAGHFGTFTQLFTYGNGNGNCPQQLALADFNGDHRLDIATSGACSGNGNVSVALAPAAGAWGGFTTTVSFPVPSGSDGGANNAPYLMSFAVADLNEDHKMDLVLGAAADGGTATYGGVAVLFGAGDGTFPTSTTYGAVFGSNVYNVATGDIDGDGHTDVYANVGTANQNGNATPTIGFGSGSGTIVASTTTTLGASSVCGAGNGGSGSIFPVVIGDLTGDGKQDIFFVSTNGLAVSQGRTVTAPIAIDVSGGSGFAGGAPSGGNVPVFATDLNGDGVGDLGGFQSSPGSASYVLFNLANYHSW